MWPAMQYCDVIINPRWRTAAILKIAKSPYLSEKSCDSDKIWYTTADIGYRMTVTWPKIEIFEIQHGGGRHLENRFFAHNSSIDCPISAKFCTRKQNGISTRATWQNLQFFLNPRWRTAAILKIVKSPYLTEKSSDFDEIPYTTAIMLNLITVTDQKLKF